jgi:sulfoxide reductase heme-binding subunit YedZ
MKWLRSCWPEIVFNLAVLAPLAALIWDFSRGQLTANPIQAVQLATGRYALGLLVVTLAISPLVKFFNLRRLLPLRRLAGLYAFGYASLHLVNFVGVDYGFNFAAIFADVGEKRYILAGLGAYLLLMPLAITSTRGWMVRLGRNWEKLHWLVYPVVLLAMTHFFWQTKADLRGPLAWSAVVVMLLAARLAGLVRGFKRRG